MKMNNLILTISLAVLTLFFTACYESDDPSLARVSMQMTASTVDGSINTTGRVSSTANLEFTQFLVGVTEIEFETLEEQEEELDGNGNEIERDDEEIEYEGVFVVDLLNGTSNPEFGFADLAGGLYEEIEVEMEPVLSDGNSIVISANYTSGDMQYQVEFTSNEEFEFEIEKENGFMLSTTSLSQILIVIDLDLLFQGVDLGAASIDADNVIRINDSSNSGLKSLIESNLNTAFEAGEDDDDDGEIDDDNDDD